MALVETLAGLRAQSTGLLADALDMLSDAGAYAIALAAIGRSPLFKARSAAANGAVVLLLGLGVLVEVGRLAPPVDLSEENSWLFQQIIE
jgi:Co/Zn/Cd efflux system component